MSKNLVRAAGGNAARVMAKNVGKIGGNLTTSVRLNKRLLLAVNAAYAIWFWAGLWYSSECFNNVLTLTRGQDKGQALRA